VHVLYGSRTLLTGEGRDLFMQDVQMEQPEMLDHFGHTLAAGDEFGYALVALTEPHPKPQHVYLPSVQQETTSR
jgi:hypothetical protein